MGSHLAVLVRKVVGRASPRVRQKRRGRDIEADRSFPTWQAALGPSRGPSQGSGDNVIVGGRTPDPVPASERAVADLVESGVAGGVVPEQDVGGAIPVEIANTDYVIGRGGPTDRMPAGQGAVVDLVEAGV